MVQDGMSTSADLSSHASSERSIQLDGRRGVLSPRVVAGKRESVLEPVDPFHFIREAIDRKLQQGDFTEVARWLLSDDVPLEMAGIRMNGIDYLFELIAKEGDFADFERLYEIVRNQMMLESAIAYVSNLDVDAKSRFFDEFILHGDGKMEPFDASHFVAAISSELFKDDPDLAVSTLKDAVGEDGGLEWTFLWGISTALHENGQLHRVFEYLDALGADLGVISKDPMFSSYLVGFLPDSDTFGKYMDSASSSERDWAVYSTIASGFGLDVIDKMDSIRSIGSSRVRLLALSYYVVPFVGSGQYDVDAMKEAFPDLEAELNSVLFNREK